MSKTVEIVSQSPCYEGYFKLYTMRLRHSLFAGGLSDILSREVFERGHAAALLPYDPAADAVVLIEQFRVGALVGLGDGWITEIVAGAIEDGDHAEDTVRRETAEESGLTVGRLEPIGRVMASPGASAECFALFCGEVDSAGAGGIHGLADEGEDIRAFVEPWDVAARRLTDHNAVMAAPAFMALQWLALNRARLRRQWR